MFGPRKVSRSNPVLCPIGEFFIENKVEHEWPEKKVDLRGKYIGDSYIVKDLLPRMEKSVIIERKYKKINNKFKCVEKKYNTITLSYSGKRRRIVLRTRSLKESFKNILPIKPSRTARFMGVTPFPVWSRKQVVLCPSTLSLEFLLENNLDCVEERFTVFPSWISQGSEFQAFCDPIRSDRNYSARKILEIVSPELKKIKLPKIGEVTENFVDIVETNADADSGFYNSLLFRKSRHRDLDQILKPASKLLFKKILKEFTPDSSIWSVGGRARMMSVNKMYSELRSRLLVMPDGLSKIVGLMVIQPFYNELSKIQRRESFNEVSLGIDFRGSGFSKYLKENNNYERVLEMDFKRFDQSIDRPVIEAAFSILRCCYPEGEAMDKIFMFLLGGFTYKNVIIPGGFIYRVSKSVPTGSPLTSIINTLCNWINMTLLMKELKVPSEKYFIRVYGDDTLIFLNHPVFEDINLLEKYILRMSGQTADPIIFHSVKDPPDSKYSFLKTQNYNGFAGRSVKEVIERALYPETHREIYDIELRLEGAFYNAPFNPESSYYLCKFLKLLREKQIERVKEKVSNDTLKNFYDDIDNFQIVPKACSNFLFEVQPYFHSEYKYEWEKRKRISYDYEEAVKVYPIEKEFYDDLLFFNQETIDYDGLKEDGLKNFIHLWKKGRKNSYKEKNLKIKS